ncbi:hypothetical protein V496_02184 [Pseudogymnoascus sp. VKM F-4515 (FW-2607)]|nr:hypothetical protein V496_02184 [Pseudogymnoascus sp. VKM F-4515 (FW-2607)]KFY96786.1 hypothetical protein V498_02484 [Pseudogymnoascus sp. VKM F-4517 (FW-2822)]
MSASSTSSPRIPAWKRLGLKLKSVGDAPSPVAAAATTEYVAAEQPKRKRAADEVESTPIKKSKKSLKNAESTISSTPTAVPDDKLGRRKSVAFTPDTKVEDGDSIKQLFNSWVAEQKKLDPLFASKNDQPSLQTPEPTKVDEKVDPALPEPERRVKRVKSTNPDDKTKAKKSKSKVVKSKPIDPALTYLTQFHSDKVNWKFNKINQIAVLKNAFDTDLIPTEYNQPLYEYITGLKGVARVHLRDRALEIRDKDVEEGAKGFTGKMTDDQRTKKQEEYETAIEEYVSTMTSTAISSRAGLEEGILLGLNPDTAMKQRMTKRMRAEHVLNLLASTPGDPSDYAPVVSNSKPVEEIRAQPVKLEAEKPQKTVRKRKQRTAVYESDSSSSSDSDSDSGTSDEDSDDEGPTKKSKTNSDSDSDSDSSSSSSGSSSGDSSDSDGSDSSSSSESDGDESD